MIWIAALAVTVASFVLLATAAAQRKTLARMRLATLAAWTAGVGVGLASSTLL